MAGVAQLLEGVDIVAGNGVVGDNIIDDGENAVGAQDARGLADKAVNVGKVVGRNATGHQLEAGIGEGQRLGVGKLGCDIGDAALRGELFRLDQHFRREVGGDDMGNMGGKGKSGMPSGSCHIQYLPIGLGLNEFNQPLEACALGVDSTGGIGRGVCAELFLNEFFAHCSIPLLCLNVLLHRDADSADGRVCGLLQMFGDRCLVKQSAVLA